MELQQRGVEFTQLFGKYSHMRSALLERMPPMESSIRSSNQGHLETNGDVGPGDSSPEDNLLLGGGGGGTTETPDSVS